MGEIKYAETDVRRDNVKLLSDTSSPSQYACDLKHTVWGSPTKASIAVSTLMVGRPTRMDKDKDKRYYKWRTTASLGFYRNRGGFPQPYHATRPVNFKVDSNQWSHREAHTVFDYLEADSDLGRAFKHACWETFGYTRLGEFYPMADLWGIHSYKYLPYDLRPAMRENNWADFTARVFGKTRTTPRLIAAVENTDPFIVAYAQQFRGLVSDKRLVSFVEDNHFDDEMLETFDGESSSVRHAVRALNKKSRKKILARGLDMADIKRIHSISLYGKRGIRYVKKDMDYDSWSDLLTW